MTLLTAKISSFSASKEYNITYGHYVIADAVSYTSSIRGQQYLNSEEEH